MCQCYAAVDYSMDLLTAYVRTIIVQIILLFLVVVLIVVVASLLVTDRGIVRPMKRLERRAYRDTLTGLQNRTAYYEYNQALDKRIAEGTADFAIVMVDVNFLKRVNDTYGHENGNVYIRQCCRLVCTIFEHSPVFRVGGDEFVVILENSDLQGYEKLVKRFKYEIKKRSQDETLEPWEKVSAAVGVAVYDPRADHSADDVFKRADQAMYADKQAMKAVRLD